MKKVKVVDTYSGRCVALNVNEEKFNNADGWDWLTDYQRKRIENFFGNPAAYYCKVFTPEDVEYSAYYVDK